MKCAPAGVRTRDPLVRNPDALTAEPLRHLIEHINYGDNVLLRFLFDVINCIFKNGVIPDSLKVGLLTPIFKNKGEKTISKKYRGITVLPVIGKVIEAILRNRIQSIINETRNPNQRGFTAKTSPLNSALIVEETIRECKDSCESVSDILGCKVRL